MTKRCQSHKARYCLNPTTHQIHDKRADESAEAAQQDNENGETMGGGGTGSEPPASAHRWYRLKSPAQTQNCATALARTVIKGVSPVESGTFLIKYLVKFIEIYNIEDIDDLALVWIDTSPLQRHLDLLNELKNDLIAMRSAGHVADKHITRIVIRASVA